MVTHNEGGDKVPISDERLAAMQARCDAATPGPWYVEEDSGEDETTGAPWAELVGIAEDDGSPVIRKTDLGPDSDNDDDWEFMAHARTDLPDTLDEIRRLRAVVAEQDARDRVAAGLLDRYRHWAANSLMAIELLNMPDKPWWRELDDITVETQQYLRAGQQVSS